MNSWNQPLHINSIRTIMIIAWLYSCRNKAIFIYSAIAAAFVTFTSKVILAALHSLAVRIVWSINACPNPFPLKSGWTAIEYILK